MHSSAGIESLICGVQRGPQYYAGLRTGLGQSWSHPSSRRRCRARVDLAHTLGSETDPRAYVCPSGVGGIRFAHRHLGSGDSSQAS